MRRNIICTNGDLSQIMLARKHSLFMYSGYLCPQLAGSPPHSVRPRRAPPPHRPLSIFAVTETNDFFVKSQVSSPMEQLLCPSC